MFAKQFHNEKIDDIFSQLLSVTHQRKKMKTKLKSQLSETKKNTQMEYKFYCWKSDNNGVNIRSLFLRFILLRNASHHII